MKKVLRLDEPVIDLKMPVNTILHSYVKVLATVGMLENRYFFATAHRVFNVLRNGGASISVASIRNQLALLKKKGYVSLYNGNPGRYVLSSAGADVLASIASAVDLS